MLTDTARTQVPVWSATPSSFLHAAVGQSGATPMSKSFLTTGALGVLAALILGAVLLGTLWRGARMFAATRARRRWDANLHAGGWAEPKQPGTQSNPEYLAAMVAQLDGRLRTVEETTRALFVAHQRRSPAVRAPQPTAEEKVFAFEVEPRRLRPSTGIEAKPDGADRRSPLHSEVYTLADEGASVVEIAQKLGKHAGQVELILNLRRALLTQQAADGGE